MLEELVPSCECVVATLSPETIFPGGEAVLTVTFLEHEPIGEFEREVEIYGNTLDPLTVGVSGIVTAK